MTRFNTPDDVKAWAEKVAAQDLERYRKYGYDLNPYCTPQARNDWKRGFNGWPPHTWESATTLDFCTKYQRGRAMARLLDQQPDKEALWPQTLEVEQGLTPEFSDALRASAGRPLE